MPITVRVPVSLRQNTADTLTIAEPVRTIAELIEVLDRRLPGFRAQFDDSMLNFAVNDEMVLHRAGERSLADGDVVEIVPTISGGGMSVPSPWQRRDTRSPRYASVATTRVTTSSAATTHSALPEKLKSFNMLPTLPSTCVRV